MFMEVYDQIVIVTQTESVCLFECWAGSRSITYLLSGFVWILRHAYWDINVFKEIFISETMVRQKKKPSLFIPEKHFYVHSLTGLCNALRRELVVDIVRYSKNFHKLFMKHFTSETEVKIEDSVITAESELEAWYLGRWMAGITV